MSGQCSFIKPSGERCKGAATGQHGSLCWAHDPANADKRRRVASRGGKGKAAKRVAVLWDEVRSVIERVQSGVLHTSRANSALRGYSVLIDLAKLEVEQSELAIAERRLQLDEQERLELVNEIEQMREILGARKETSWAG